MEQISEFKGKIVVGVTIAIVAAMGLAVFFAAFTPSVFQSSTSTLTRNSVAVTVSSSLDSTMTITTSSAVQSMSSRQAETNGASPSLSKSSDGWNFTVSLTSTGIEQGQNITADFSLTNVSGKNQTVDIANPLVVPEVYFQNGTEIFTNWNPTIINQIKNISAGQTLSLNGVTIATFKLPLGRAYVVTFEPGVRTSDYFFIGKALEINATVTVT
jgi:hypothetical protein